MGKRTMIALVCVGAMAITGPAAAHHHSRLFTNAKGDHGGSFNRGHKVFFWLAKRKRFDHLRVCIRRHGSAREACVRFEVRRVPAASYKPWGVQFTTDKHFTIGKGKWDLRFWHGRSALSPILGFHRYSN
jgi:hypothetical protein